jgi:Mrp family chromosome partitioning ATPase
LSRNLDLLKQIGAAEKLFQVPEGASVSTGDVAPQEWAAGQGGDGALAGSSAYYRPVLLVDTPKRPLDRNLMAREEVLKLVQRVFLLPKNGATAAVVVFSGIAAENGCGRVCTRAAETLATQIKGSICVVDASLRAPHIHEYFGVENHRGLANYMLQSGPARSFTYKLPAGNIWVMPAGSSGVPAETVLSSERLRVRLADLRREFDYVLIGAPPVNLFAETLVLGQIADGLVLVVQANATRRDAARKAKESLQDANVRVLGAVLDNRTFPIPDAIYTRI